MRKKKKKKILEFKIKKKKKVSGDNNSKHCTVGIPNNIRSTTRLLLDLGIVGWVNF